MSDYGLISFQNVNFVQYVSNVQGCTKLVKSFAFFWGLYRKHAVNFEQISLI